MQKMIQGSLTLDSREVAEMVEKRHDHLIRDIQKYSEYLNAPKFGVVDFFIKSEYTDSKGERRLCYQITKKGCELIAHKMTGKKGTQFTATYINRFHDMENSIQKIENVQTDYTILDGVRDFTHYDETVYLTFTPDFLKSVGFYDIPKPLNEIRSTIYNNVFYKNTLYPGKSGKALSDIYSFKTLRGENVILFNDVADIAGIPKHLLRYYLNKGILTEGTEYFSLEGVDLIVFKRENEIYNSANHLTVFNQSGIDKLIDNRIIPQKDNRIAVFSWLLNTPKQKRLTSFQKNEIVPQRNDESVAQLLRQAAQLLEARAM